MATRKKVASNRRTTGVKSIVDSLPSLNSRSRGAFNLKTYTNSTTVRYIAGGLALYGLVRLAMKVSHRYPQIGEFVSENIDTVEGKFRDWTGRSEDEMADSRH